MATALFEPVEADHEFFDGCFCRPLQNAKIGNGRSDFYLLAREHIAMAAHILFAYPLEPGSSEIRGYPQACQVLLPR